MIDIIICSDSSLWKVACWSLLALLCKETGIMALAIVAVWTVSLTSCKTSWHRAAKYWVVVRTDQLVS